MVLQAMTGHSMQIYCKWILCDIDSEDEADEIHRRIDLIDHQGKRFTESKHDLKVLPFPNYGGVKPIVTTTRDGPANRTMGRFARR